MRSDLLQFSDAYNVIEGHITHIERNDERLPSGGVKIASKILIGLLMFFPYLVMFLASLVLSFIFGILRFDGLSRLFNPVIWTTMIVELMEVMVLRNLRGMNTIPVYRGVIECSDGKELHFMLTGPLTGSNLVSGNHVRLNGRWKKGSLYVNSGEDLRSGAVISSGYRNPWPAILFFVFCLYLIIVLCVIFYVPQITRYL